MQTSQSNSHRWSYSLEKLQYDLTQRLFSADYSTVQQHLPETFNLIQKSQHADLHISMPCFWGLVQLQEQKPLDLVFVELPGTGPVLFRMRRETPACCRGAERCERSSSLSAPIHSTQPTSRPQSSVRHMDCSHLGNLYDTPRERTAVLC